MHAKVDHPGLLWVAEILGGLGKGSERGRSGLLLPNLSAFAGWRERNPQVLLVPFTQRFRIFGPEEQPAYSGYFFHSRSFQFRVSSCFRRRICFRRSSWVGRALRRPGKFNPGKDKA